jgi:hypothetical protein
MLLFDDISNLLQLLLKTSRITTGADSTHQFVGDHLRCFLVSTQAHVIENGEVGGRGTPTEEGVLNDSIAVGVVISLLVDCAVRAVTQSLVPN